MITPMKIKFSLALLIDFRTHNDNRDKENDKIMVNSSREQIILIIRLASDRNLKYIKQHRLG